FDDSGNGVIICLYVDDMLIFGTDQDQVDKTKEFLSSKFDMKDLGEAEVILGIRIKRGNNGISVSQFHYIEKILTKFNFENYSPVSTHVDPTVKFRHNKGTPVSQLEYSRAIGCLITPNKNSKQTPYEIWTKKVPNLTYLRVWGYRAVVRLTEPKMKILGEKGIDCIFIGYAEHSKCYRFYVIEPNDYVSVNSIIESRDAIFDEERFTSIPRPRGMIQPSSSKITEDEVEGADDVLGPSVTRKSTRTRKAKSFGSDFQLYLVEGTRDKIVSLREYCYIIEEDP
nr:zinc finger, CCHC-type [Tanacetum cinerariifolium]